MAPRKPSDISSEGTPPPLKAKTEKSKIEKAKIDKPKVMKTKKEKGEGGPMEKPKALKKEKVVADDETKDKSEKPEKKVIKRKAEGEGKKDAGCAAKDGKDGKVKPVTGEEACELIINYLKEQNRPYGATDVSANLHGKVTKTVADKLLKEMEQNGRIKGKATKKDGTGQWVFWPIQDPADTATPEELASMDTQISQIRESLPALKAQLKLATTKLSNLKSAPTTSELVSIVTRLGEGNKLKAEKLRGFKDGSIKMVTKEEMETVEKEFRYWGLKRVTRKKCFGELEALLLEGMSREDIWERAGIEADVD